MNYYPSSLPPPQQRGYSYKIKPNIIRTQMADGHVRQRLVNTLHFEKTFLNSKTSMTTNRIIAELNKYCIDQNEDDTWYPSYAMNKDQKEILSNVGITEDDVHKFITKIASGH